MELSCDIWSTAKSGGCAAKLSPLVLRDLVRSIAPRGHPELLVGLDPSDAAAVYRVTADLAIVLTLDFITPIFPDPYLFGQVAAANSLSDVWAMGGRPATAMNVCCFPGKGVDGETLGRILQGGLSKIEEAGAVLVGGHTVRDDELKYGLSVTGFVHPNRIALKGGARPGDLLILTKPVGSGIHVSGAKRGLVPMERLRTVIETLAELNKTAGETMMEFDVRGATDVTGFGLGGHALEMARQAGLAFRIQVDRLPVFPGTLPLLEKGVTTSVTAQNLALIEREMEYDAGVTPAERGLFSDPQTSGGLLIAIRGKDAEALLEKLHRQGVTDARIIGEAFAADAPHLEVVKG
jgi:selenide,water dikinase